MKEILVWIARDTSRIRVTCIIFSPLFRVFCSLNLIILFFFFPSIIILLLLLLIIIIIMSFSSCHLFALCYLRLNEAVQRLADLEHDNTTLTNDAAWQQEKKHLFATVIDALIDVDPDTELWKAKMKEISEVNTSMESPFSSNKRGHTIGT